MISPAARTLALLGEIPNLAALADAPLARYTRFAIGGPADVYAEAGDEKAFLAALDAARESDLPVTVMGGGTNLVVADEGFRGLVLRYTADRLEAESSRVTAQAGAVLQDLVDFTVAHGLGGLQTLAGIPGSVGAAVYGNAGAYGHSISERVERVRFFDGGEVRVWGRAECAFAYRDSVFKRCKDWVVFSVELELEKGDADALRREAAETVEVRNRKFPVTMKCAGSIFKNLLLAQLPAAVAARLPEGVAREGKVPAAWFLEQAGAKGMRAGDIHVADYHANLIYNAGGGSAADLRRLIHELKSRVSNKFGIVLEEEVQYIGFGGSPGWQLAPPEGPYTSA